MIGVSSMVGYTVRDSNPYRLVGHLISTEDIAIPASYDS
jgi:hypothetical protein